MNHDYETPHPRRKLRLPQLSKHNHLRRKHGLRSEFILMCYAKERERQEK